MRIFQVLGAGLSMLLSLCALPSTAVAQQSSFAARAPTGWTVVERYTSDQRMQQKNSLIDFVGDNYPYPGPKAANFTQQELAVSITVRSTDAEGGSLDALDPSLDEQGGGHDRAGISRRNPAIGHAVLAEPSTDVHRRVGL